MYPLLTAAGSHPEFVNRLHDLERERDESIEKANMWRDYQLQCAEAMYKTETEQAEQEYMVGFVWLGWGGMVEVSPTITSHPITLYDITSHRIASHPPTHPLPPPLQSEKMGLREKMLAQIEERRKKLREDRDTLAIDNGTILW